MLRGISSSVILITLVLALWIMIVPASAANTTTETTGAVNQTTALPTVPAATNQTTVPPPDTTVAATQTTVPPTGTAATANQTVVPPTGTTVAATPTNATPSATTIAVTRPTTVVSEETTTPVPSAVSTGSVSVYSSPAGAGILIDGRYLGTTPKTIPGIPAGNHILRLSLSGYHDYEGSIYVVAGQTTPGYGTLQPLSQVVSPDPATTMVIPVIVPVVTAAPDPAQDTGLLGNAGVLAAIIGAIGVVIASFAKIYTHAKPPKKE